MTAFAVLLAYALIVGSLGGHLLSRARWPERAPRLGIAAWQAATTSTLAAVVLAGLAPALPGPPIGADLAGLLHTCVMHLRERYATPGGAVAVSAGILLSVVVTARAAYSLAGAARAARSGRRRQLEQLALVAHRDATLGALIVDHPSLAAYCVPGGPVVLSTGTLSALDREQVAAVLEHERAHQRGRHALLVQWVSAIHAAFPFVPTFAASADAVARLAEMAADDVAGRRVDRLTLATAVVRLAAAAAPVGALGAGGSTAVRRVQRLADQSAPLSRMRLVLLSAGISLVATAPIVLMLGPALTVAWADFCPISMHA